MLTLADSLNPIAPGGAWLGDGSIIYSDQNWNLRRVPVSGGKPTVVADDSLSLLYPRALPRTDAILATGCEAVCERMWIGVVDLRTQRFRRLQEDATSGWYSPTGHIVFVRRSGIVAALPFDFDALEARGEPITLFDGVRVSAGIAPSFTLSPKGTLLYSTSGTSWGVLGSIVRVTRTGDVTPLDPAWPPSEIGQPVLSADGKQLAVAVVKDQRSDIWIKQLDRGALSRLTTEGELNFSPTWRPDGSIGYVSSIGGWHLRFRRPDGTGAVSRLVLPNTTYLSNPAWSPDGSWVVFQRLDGTRNRIDALRIGTDTIVPVVASPGVEAMTPVLSPNGQWLAYASTESGRFEVYIRPFPDVMRERVQISPRGGRMPAWARSGTELYFLSESQEIMSVPVTTIPRLVVGEPRPVLSARGFVMDQAGRSYEPEPSGRSFLMIRGEEKTPAPELVIVLNWSSELATKVRAR